MDEDDKVGILFSLHKIPISCVRHLRMELFGTAFKRAQLAG